MLINISHQNPKPLYDQIVEQIKMRILSGELKPGEPLPSIRQLAADLTTSVITTKRAYQELEREGLITTRPGLGSFVAELRVDMVRETHRQELVKRFNELIDQARSYGFDNREIRKLIDELLSDR